MARNGYADRLRQIPALSHCTHGQLAQIAQVVDDVQLPAGTQLTAQSGELVVTLAPTRVLVVDRRARTSVLDAAPELGTRTSEVRLHPA
jgi:hypothetical protein